MQGLKAILLSALVGLTLAMNATIRYFSTKEGCVESAGYFQCSNVAFGHCCQSSAPWCTYVDCPDCITNGVGGDNGLRRYLLPTHANEDCSGDAISPVCASTSRNTLCCSINNGKEPAVCSSYVTYEVKEAGEDCLGVVQPDTFVYMDAEGLEHSMHIPNGTFEQAVQDWDALKSLGLV